jgi:exonuclease VII large subunit
MSYRSTLGRGFSITRIKKGGIVVRQASQVRDGTRVVTEVADGEFESRVVDQDQLELFE